MVIIAPWGGLLFYLESGTSARDHNYYLQPASVVPFLFCFSCLSTGLRKNYRPDFHETVWKSGALAKKVSEQIQSNTLLTFFQFYQHCEMGHLALVEVCSALLVFACLWRVVRCGCKSQTGCCNPCSNSSENVCWFFVQKH